MTSPPEKTALGRQELRVRTRKLSQRHRTMLLLVDGKRSHGEVLALAEQAGVATSHFDALVEMGLIEWSGETTAPVVETIAPAATPRTGEAALPPADSDSVASDEAVDVGSTSAAVVTDAPAPTAGAGDGMALAPALAPTAAVGPPAAPDVVSAPYAQRAPDSSMPCAQRASDLPQPAQDVAPQAEDAEIAQARGLLIGTLSDGTARSQQTLQRIRAARDRETLIELVWQIDRNLGRGRHAAEVRRSLARARELLGLGNTVFYEDSRPHEDA